MTDDNYLKRKHMKTSRGTAQEHGLRLSGGMENLAELLQPLPHAEQDFYSKEHHFAMGTTQGEQHGQLHQERIETERNRREGELASTGECGQ